MFFFFIFICFCMFLLFLAKQSTLFYVLFFTYMLWHLHQTQLMLTTTSSNVHFCAYIITMKSSFTIRVYSLKTFFKQLAIVGLLLCIVGSVFLCSYYVPKLNQVDLSYRGVIILGDEKSNNVSVMINVCWGEEYLHSMLEELNKRNIQTTFFVGGEWANRNPNMLKKIVENGHELGNHGYFHKDHDKLSYQQNLDEILMCHKIVQELTGVQMNVFAPPSGAYNEYTTKAATHLGYKTIMWSKDTIDWRDQDVNVIYTRALQDIKGGDLILMHPTKASMEALPQILDAILSKGLNVTTVSKTLEQSV